MEYKELFEEDIKGITITSTHCLSSLRPKSIKGSNENES